MAFTGKNPKTESIILNDQGSGSVPNPASGSHKVVDRNGVMYVRDSAGNETAMGSGGGELNAVTSPNTAAGWTASGAGVTVATSTTSTDLPLSPIIGTSIKVTPVSSTDYAYHRFTMPVDLENRKLKLEMWIRALSGYTSGDLKVDLYVNSASNYGGSYTRVALSTDVSGATSLPNMSGKFTSYFDADSNLYYELRIVRVSGTTAMNFANIVVGPGIQAQGAVVSEWQSYTPTGSWSTNTTYTGLYRRVGNQIQLKIGITLSGAPTGSLSFSSTQALNGLGITYSPTASAPTNSTKAPSGLWNGTRTGVADYFGQMYVNDSTSSTPTWAALMDGTSSAIAVNATTPATWASGDKFGVELSFAIAEWTGAGTLNTAQNDVEHAYNSSTSTTTDTTSFAYGPSGAFIQAFSNIKKRVRFLSPIQTSDSLKLEFMAANGAWIEQPLFLDGSLNAINTFTFQASNSYGAGLQIVNSTDVDVCFALYAQQAAASYGGAGVAWSSYTTTMWRVKKVKAGVAAGFGQLTGTQAGLMPANLSNLDDVAATRMGLKAYNSATSYNGGISPTLTVNAGTVNSVPRSQFIPYQIQDGSWRLKFNFSAVLSSTSRGSTVITINGITFKNIANYNQTVCFSGQGGATAAHDQMYTLPNTGGLELDWASANSLSVHCVSGDVELESKPTWAY